MSAWEWTLPLFAACALAIVMAAGWLVQRRTRNAGIVDLLWAAGVGVTAVAFAIAAEGWWPRRVLIAALAGTWALRLSILLARRLSREREDGRYAELRAALGARFEPAMLAWFLGQALLVGVLSLSFLAPCASPEAGFGLRDAAGVLVWLVAIAGEWVSDRQLHAWRSNPLNRGRTCTSGLWRYSRHPNYFFEWVHWVAYPVIAIGLAWGWIGWIAPLVMLVLVCWVTGIPPAERQSLRSRGDDYRAYQRSTSAFFPWPPRRSARCEARPLPTSVSS